jgi:hypothetical protein
MIHMTVLFGDERSEDKVRQLLGPPPDSCDIFICSNPIAFRNREIIGASSVHYGVTTIRRRDGKGDVFSVSAPFYPPVSFDISDLLNILERTSDQRERELLCQKYCARLRATKILSGAGMAMRAANLIACCAVVFLFGASWLRRAVRGILEILARQERSTLN